MDDENRTEDQALADCNEAVNELTNQNAELKEENQELREAANTFGDLAERLTVQLRKEGTTAEDDATTAPRAEGDVTDGSD